MSCPDPAPVRRPAVVTFAAAGLLLMALGALGYAVASLVNLAGTVDRFRSTVAGTADDGEIDTVVTLVRVTVVLSAVVTVLVGLLLAGLAVGLLAGRRGARVATWVVAGFGGCCGGGALALLLGQRLAPLRLADDDPTTAALLAAVPEAYPSWWIPLNAGVSVGQLVGYLVVITLLVLPAAHTWFARRTPSTGSTDQAPGGPPAQPPRDPVPPVRMTP
ncbi:hypothetical protein ACN28G_26925 [Micromonospora sp. WMMA1923]|uniref:hypothetical protein n=1 Tax=Micromonospora sp. WMMA1923 TaxID=3404125 RepID=UPI003B930972